MLELIVMPLKLYILNNSKLLIPLAITAIVIGYLVIINLTSDADLADGIVIAERKNITQEVSVTGRVEPVRSVNLAFDRGGRIANAPVNVGDSVILRQILISLENSDLAAKLTGARADVSSAEAKLDALKLGTRIEELQVKRREVTNAEGAYERERQALVDSVRDSFTKSDDAIRSKIDQFFDNPETSVPKISFTTGTSRELEAGRVNMITTLKTLQSIAATIDISDDIKTDTKASREGLLTVKRFLDDISLAVNAAKPSSTLSGATIDGYKTNVTTARTNINAALTNLSSAEEAYILSEQSLDLAKDQLLLLEAGATDEAIRQQEAAVKGAEALVSQYIADLEKTRIRAPFAGVVTKRNFEVGEVVAANTSVISLIAPLIFQITANVPEADIAKIHVDNTAVVTLDAYGSDMKFSATVVSIDPAETILEGVATYKVTLVFPDEDGMVRSGMTANVDIKTAMIENVIAIPFRSVFSRDGQKIVRVINKDGEMEEIIVSVGLRGSLGDIEIKNGISEGDKIVVFITE
jgi:RND family efflux transporter MFP subunit